MTLHEAMFWADNTTICTAAKVLAAEIRRLQALCKTIPAQKAQAMPKTEPIAECNLVYWDLPINEIEEK